MGGRLIPDGRSLWCIVFLLIATSAFAQSTKEPRDTGNAWVAATSLPNGTARYGFAQNGEDFYVFSGITITGPTNAVLRYNAMTDTWTPLADIPLASEASAAAYYNGKVYLIDGENGGGGPSENRIRIYDIANNSWTSGATRPVDDSSYGAAVGAFNGKVYVVGGRDSARTTLSIYDIASNTWSSGPTPPSPFKLGGHTQVGKFLYLVGSFTFDPATNSSTTMRLDMSTVTWEMGPDFTPRRADCALAASGSKLYAIGGDANGGSYFDGNAEVDELETAQWNFGAWVVSPEALPVERQGNQAGFFSIGRVNGEIWSTGGYTFATTGFRSDHLYRAAPAVVTPTPTPSPGSLQNVSTRANIGVGDNVLIGGFIITGTQPKKVILRAIGPSLPLAGVLANPQLELHDHAGNIIGSNDNWRSTQEAEIIASTIPPTNDEEAAIVATLPANNSAYTAIVSGVSNGTGVGLVEVYDLDSAAASQLANISSRGLVQTGDNVMIGGFIISGNVAHKVIVRAIGPSLPVDGRMSDPTLELFDANGTSIGFNNDWRSDQEAEIIATTVPPGNNLEAAIVRTLRPASYTAIVRGKDGTTGVALVEVYSLEQ